MRRLDLLVLQSQPSQVDSPLFVDLVRRGVKLEVRYASANIPVDPELGIRPDLGEVLSGYPWSRVRPSSPLDDVAPRHVVISGWSTAWAGAALVQARLRGIPCGIRFDVDGLGPSTPLRRAASEARARAALRVSTVWHPTGSRARRYACNVAGASRPVLPIPYAVDAEAFAALAPASGASPASRASSDGVVRILAINKLVAREGVETLVRAVAGLDRFHVTVVGAGSDEQRLRRLSSSLGAPVEFAGYAPYPTLRGHYARADFFVHPALHESWGVSVQEAMASGLPVLASTGVGSADDLLPPDEPVRFEPEDSARLRELILGLTDPAVRSTMGAANRARALAASCRNLGSQIVDFLNA